MRTICIVLGVLALVVAFGGCGVTTFLAFSTYEPSHPNGMLPTESGKATRMTAPSTGSIPLWIDDHGSGSASCELRVEDESGKLLAEARGSSGCRVVIEAHGGPAWLVTADLAHSPRSMVYVGQDASLYRPPLTYFMLGFVALGLLGAAGVGASMLVRRSEV